MSNQTSTMVMTLLQSKTQEEAFQQRLEEVATSIATVTTYRYRTITCSILKKTTKTCSSNT